MITNNPPDSGISTGSPVLGMPTTAKNPLPARAFSNAERMLLLISLSIAILFDRLLFAPLFWDEFHLPFLSAIFWLAFLAIFYTLFWKRLRDNRILWMVSAFVVLLCIWNFLFDYQGEYGTMTMPVIPAVIMAHVVYSTGGYHLKDVGIFVSEWLSGWVFKPFSAISKMFGAADSLVAHTKRTTLKKVVLGVLCTLPLLFVILPLLGSADLVFGYYLTRMLGGFNFASFASHGIAIVIAAALFYSYLWNIGYAERKPAKERLHVSIDDIVSFIVLGTTVAVYTLFCVVQFTYLFAGAGLPANMTYSEYAREGFAQIIVICAINLFLFGVFLQYGKHDRAVSVLLASLLCLSGAMLDSGFVRLTLYIQTYGLTWLRMFSAWFILYLAAVIALSFVRMLHEKLPLIAVSAFVLLGWYTVLGYANPDGLIMKYNLQTNDYTTNWLQENKYYLAGLSDDAILALLDEDLPFDAVSPVMQARLHEDGSYSLSSYRLKGKLSQYIT